MEQRGSTRELDEAWRNGALQAVMKIILNPRETQHNYKLYLNSVKRYETFEEGLKTESGKDVELLMAGSMAECLFAQHWVYKDSRREAKNDIDIMLVDHSMIVTEKIPALGCSTVPGDPDFEDVLRKGKLSSIQEQVQRLKRETEATESLQNASECGDPRPVSLEPTQKVLFAGRSNHPGYVHLYELDLDGKPALLTTESFNGFWSGIVNKTALYSLVTSGPQLPSGGAVASGPALNRRDRPSSRNNYAHDYVPCLHCPKWPTMADSWSERKRSTDWPRKGLISDIIGSGCYVVPVSHHDNDNEPYHTEWRLSFSIAEKRLVHSLSIEQRQSYIITKLIMKQVIQELKDSHLEPPLEKTPSSYHLKTIFLWKCEEKHSEEWKNLLYSAVELLETFVVHLRRGNIPNYFVPENNMIGHINHQDLLSVANAIAASLCDLPAMLHSIFLASFDTLLGYDSDTSAVLRLVDCQLKNFCQSGIPGDMLYLCYILNSLVDSLSAAITGTCDERQLLEDHKHLLNIYCSHQRTVGIPVTLPPHPVLGAAESSTTVIALFQYLYTLLKDSHILAVLQFGVFAVLARIFLQSLPTLSLREQLSGERCEESLSIYQNVCEKLGIVVSSELSCHDELSALYGVGYIFSKYPKFAELETFCFVAQRYHKFKTGGQLERLKFLQW